MSNIEDAFVGNKALITYLMAGDPSLEASARYILTAQEAGADLLEVGVPFSDPIAEGEVIQAASSRALSAGTTLDGIFKMLESLHGKLSIPVVLMTYLNPVFAYGYHRFFANCADVGISGIIVPDMPFEEQGEVKSIARECGVDVITLIAPTSEKRIGDLAKHAEGFIYLVSSLGTTGMRREITTNLSPIVADIRAVTSTPVAIGFGIATPEQAKRYSTLADGVIVGSAVVRIVGQYGSEASEALFKYLTSMRRAIE